MLLCAGVQWMYSCFDLTELFKPFGSMCAQAIQQTSKSRRPSGGPVSVIAGLAGPYEKIFSTVHLCTVLQFGPLVLGPKFLYGTFMYRTEICIGSPSVNRISSLTAADERAHIPCSRTHSLTSHSCTHHSDIRHSHFFGIQCISPCRWRKDDTAVTSL